MCFKECTRLTICATRINSHFSEPRLALARPSVTCAHRAALNRITASVYLGAAPTETPGAVGTSLPWLRSSWAACASRRTPCRRTTSRRPRWAAAGTERSCAACGSTPRFPCWTRTPPHCLREKTRLCCGKLPRQLLSKKKSPHSLNTPRTETIRQAPLPADVRIINLFSA